MDSSTAAARRSSAYDCEPTDVLESERSEARLSVSKSGVHARVGGFRPGVVDDRPCSSKRHWRLTDRTDASDPRCSDEPTLEPAESRTLGCDDDERPRCAAWALPNALCRASSGERVPTGLAAARFLADCPGVFAGLSSGSSSERLSLRALNCFFISSSSALLAANRARVQTAALSAAVATVCKLSLHYSRTNAKRSTTSNTQRTNPADRP